MGLPTFPIRGINPCMRLRLIAQPAFHKRTVNFLDSIFSNDSKLTISVMIKESYVRCAIEVG